MPPIDYRKVADVLAQSKRARKFSDGIEAGVAAEIAGDRSHIIGAVGVARPFARQREIPAAWSVIHVMDRMEEAWITLSHMSVPTRPRGYANAMPVYAYDRFDLNAQLETLELERTMRDKNRVRLPPSPEEISRMDEAFFWPVKYLGGHEQHHIALAVNLGTRRAAFGSPINDDCKRLGIPRRAFLKRKMLGLTIIASRLIVDRIVIR